ncbi:TonB-dependent receptor [Edaphobacter bradus]|uniref:TonB-dependent receptor n=1 Tax=Edaphobacter bradus TaxID=2259016 RepID=UPI0021E065C3|nr:TonB-dependent receptor [Edaphobacter bradus]
MRVCVRDESGGAVADASVQVQGDSGRRVVSDATGCASLTVLGEQSRLEVAHAGFDGVVRALGDEAEIAVVLRVAAREEAVEVTAARTPLALDASASSVRTMSPQQLEEAPALTLDDRLRQVAGFQLFRRTSSWVANPTTEGTSLRGLGSTAASRTLVLSDLVPLNDSFGGWIHWNEIPQLATREVELMRGGASDLYGSSAIGGVIDVMTVTPEKFGYAVDLSGASEATSILNGLLTAGDRNLSALGAVTLFRTDGYILTAPEARGAVDIPSNVHSQSGRVEMRHGVGSDGAVFLRGNLLNEARSNGTPLQTNATRIWRYATGADWTANEAGRFVLRLHGTNQGYRQSFSSIASNRATEKLTRLQVVPSAQMGGALQWARTWRALTVVAGSDVLDTRGTDDETPVSNGVHQATQSISARQRDTGVYGEALWQPRTWSIAFSSRVDWFNTFDAKAVGVKPTPVLPTVAETIFDPRLGVVKQLGGGVSLTASGFRAFRGPSMNELYRTGQVGQQTTLANPNLRSERATGWEAGGLVNVRHLGSVRSSYFWTQVNRPIAAVTLRSTPTSTLMQRQNLGQLESRGVSLEAEIRPMSFLTLTGGYQYANSTVTKFQADPTLVGKWTAQVPRNSATLQARMERQRWGVFSVDLRTSGQQFDDSANQFRLNGYAQVDLYAEHSLWERLRVYGSVQNLADSRIEAGRTPILTLASPRIVVFGLRFH